MKKINKKVGIFLIVGIILFALVGLGTFFSLSAEEIEARFGIVIEVPMSSVDFNKEDVVGGIVKIHHNKCFTEDEFDGGLVPSQDVLLDGIVVGSGSPKVCETITQDPTEIEAIKLEEVVTDFIVFEIDPSFLTNIEFSGLTVSEVSFFQRVDCSSNNHCFTYQDVIRGRSSVCDLTDGSATKYECVAGEFKGVTTTVKELPPEVKREKIYIPGFFFILPGVFIIVLVIFGGFWYAKKKR